MPLSTEQAKIADEAVSRVQSALAQAREAVSYRSGFLVYLTGADSTSAAQDEDLRQTEKIYAQLQAKRPGLEPADLPGFLQLAAAGAQVGDLVQSAIALSPQGFANEVIAPTLNDLNPLNIRGPIGKVFLGAVVIAIAYLVFRAKGAVK